MPEQGASEPRTLTRRRLLRRGLALSALGAAGLGLYAWRFEPFWWTSVHRSLPIENLPPALEGRTLVQVSDLHVGPRVDEDYITRAVRAVGRFSPDIVVVTGDLVHGGTPDDVDQATRVLRGLPHGRLGTLAILGNHDYGRGWAEPAAAARVVRCATDLGIDVLRNEVRDVGGLHVAGLDDLWAGRCRPEAVVPGLDPQRASLVLCHNPDGADEPGWGDWKGWILSGHTHGGQCKPPFLPPPLLPVRNRRYTRGEIDLRDGRRLYINAGLGYLRRVRFNVRPEITVFTLAKA